MESSEIENELRRNEKLKKIVQRARKISRRIIRHYFSKEFYTERQKQWELQFFYEDIKFIRRKWILEIIWELEDLPGVNFNELKRRIGKISSGALSDRLKQLESIIR